MSTIASELTVTIKDEEKSLRSKFLLHESYEVSYENELIKKCIAESLKSFEGDPSDVRIKIVFSL